MTDAIPPLPHHLQPNDQPTSNSPSAHQHVSTPSLWLKSSQWQAIAQSPSLIMQASDHPFYSFQQTLSHLYQLIINGDIITLSQAFSDLLPLLWQYPDSADLSYLINLVRYMFTVTQNPHSETSHLNRHDLEVLVLTQPPAIQSLTKTIIDAILAQDKITNATIQDRFPAILSRLFSHDVFQRPVVKHVVPRSFASMHKFDDDIILFSDKDRALLRIQLKAPAAIYAPYTLYRLLWHDDPYATLLISPIEGIMIDDHPIKKKPAKLAKPLSPIMIVTDPDVAIPHQLPFSQFIIRLSKPVTSLSVAKLYTQLFKKGIKHIISIHTNQSIAPYYSFAKIAASRRKYVTVYDSGAYSLGLGLMVKLLSLAIAKKKSKKFLHDMTHQIIISEHHWVYLDNIDHLDPSFEDTQLHGQIQRLKSLQLKPIISIQKEIHIIGAYLDQTMAIDSMAGLIHQSSLKKQTAIHRMSIEYHHMFEEAVMLKKTLQTLCYNYPISIYEAGPFTKHIYGDRFLGVSVV